MIRNLILSGGIYHPFAETSASIAVQLGATGITSEICSVADGLKRLQTETFDLVCVNALAFSMTQAEKYAPLRSQYAFEIDAAGTAALQRHTASGRGLLGLHTAPICFDTWDGWGDLLGVRWVWGQSGHPMPDYLDVTHHNKSFRIWDELYGGLELHAETEVLATASLAFGGRSNPIMTAKRNAVYLALGHDLTSVSSPNYSAMLQSAAQLALQPQEERV